MGLCSHAEGINGRNQPHENQAVSQWPELYGTSLLGGSDAHNLDELGRVTTFLHRPVTNRRDFINALKSNAFSLATDTNLYGPGGSISPPAASLYSQSL